MRPYYLCLLGFLLLFSCTGKKHFREGSLLLKQKNYPGAYSAFDRYVSSNPKMPRAYMKRAYAAWLAGNEVQAYKDIEKILQLDSLNTLALCNRGFLKQQSGRVEQALVDYNKALSIDKRNTDAYLNRASVYLVMGMKDKAVEDIEKSLSYGRFSAENFACAKGWHFYLRGVSRMKKQEYEGAVIYFSNAIAADSLNGRAYFERGLAYKALNDKGNSCMDLTKARELGMKVNYEMLPPGCNGSEIR